MTVCRGEMCVGTVAACSIPTAVVAVVAAADDGNKEEEQEEEEEEDATFPSPPPWPPSRLRISVKPRSLLIIPLLSTYA